MIKSTTITTTAEHVIFCINAWPRALAEELYDTLTEWSIRNKIQPDFTHIEWVQITIRYVDRCFREPALTIWDTTPTLAAHDILKFYNKAMKEGDNKSLLLIENWIESVYRVGSDETRRVVVDALLEHVFQIKGAKKRFRIWLNDPCLVVAYMEASN